MIVCAEWATRGGNMASLAVHLIAIWAAAQAALKPGEHVRSVKVEGRRRTYIVHVPRKHDTSKPAPVVLAFHGAGMNGSGMMAFTGLNKKADEAGFLAVYPDGTGLGRLLLTWNAGGVKGKAASARPDDVAFVRALLDDLAGVVAVDANRVYATGMSNGGMMCYRLAAELSDRIAAIAPVAGTMAVEKFQPKRPVGVVHFHGTADRIVPFGGAGRRMARFFSFRSVRQTIRLWAKHNGCDAKPKVTRLADRDKDDGTTVTRETYAGGKGGPEVVLYTIHGGGHTWPGQRRPFGFLGRSTRDISANDLIWAFFRKHARKARPGENGKGGGDGGAGEKERPSR